MKPNTSAASARWLSRDDTRDGRRDSFPRVEFEFQPRRFGGSFGAGGPPWRRPGFNDLAGKVFLADASRSFRLETAVLGFVTLICAWPIGLMISEVIRLLR